jgi:hypothetical protein
MVSGKPLFQNPYTHKFRLVHLGQKQRTMTTMLAFAIFFDKNGDTF